MTAKVRVGIIGCGHIARTKHIPNLSKLPDVEIVAFQDVSLDMAKKVKEALGFHHAFVFSDVDIMLQEDMDVVHICTPNDTHASISIKAMEAGKHVMVEKPMATNAADAKRMVEVSKKTGKKLSVSMQNRFRRDSLILKDFMDQGQLGEVYFAKAHATRRRCVPVHGKFLDKNYQGGGPLIDIGVHALDLTLWLMDNFEPAYAVGTTYNHLGKQNGLFNTQGQWDPREFTVEDSGFGFVVMKNGATVFLESSWAMNALDVKEAKATLCGTKAGADMNDGLTINGDNNGYLYDLKPKYAKEDLEYYDDAKDDANYQEARAWISAIIHDTKPAVTCEEAYAVTRIIDAIYESSNEGKPVYF